MATLKPRRIGVIVTNHALERFHERSGVKISRKRIARKVAARLQGRLKVGLRIDGTGSTWVPVYPGMSAVLRLNGTCWVVTTFVGRGGRHELQR